MRESLNLFAQFRIGANAVLFEFADLAVDFFERFFQRLDQSSIALWRRSRSPFAVC